MWSSLSYSGLLLLLLGQQFLLCSALRDTARAAGHTSRSDVTTATSGHLSRLQHVDISSNLTDEHRGSDLGLRKSHLANVSVNGSAESQANRSMDKSKNDSKNGSMMEVKLDLELTAPAVDQEKPMGFLDYSRFF
eukprot:TRINITY_DN36098_c0_g1_i1.p1 TRINITY_DN36098_c0_g1~~TRINITY_DN36098_c0_g1_i1.p1  ORF type:complete len:135 (+),score=12.20 TRINITY_DN36098_c0_g1_i1:95-499(+)